MIDLATSLDDEEASEADRLHWWDNPDLPEDLVRFLRQLRSAVVRVDEEWSKSLVDVGKNLEVVNDDLQTLGRACETLRNMVGRPVALQGHEFPDIWCALDFLGTTMQERHEETSGVNPRELEVLRDQITDMDRLVAEVQTLSPAVDAAQQTLEMHGRRFDIIKSVFQETKTVTEAIRKMDLGAYNRRLSQLERAARTTTPPPAIDPWFGASRSVDQGRADSNNGSDTVSRLRLVEEKVLHLEKRVVGEGVTMGAFIFQSYDDLRIWLKTAVPGHRFGLFVDGVSIFEFLAQGHAESSEVLSTMYNSQKNGFHTMY